jgi:hypothetical protein
MNPPTVIALIIVAAVVIGLIASLIVNKKKGKSSCSCGCSGCAFKDSCHSGKTKQNSTDAQNEAQIETNSPLKEAE